MFWLFVVAAALTTFVIAAVSVGGVTARLAERSRRTVYDVEEAVEWIADELPPDVSAEVSYDDVRAVLLALVDYLEQKGIASAATADDPGSQLIVVDDDHELAWILGRLEEQGHGRLSDEHVAAILDANTRYERSIGVIGPAVVSESPDGG